MSLESIPGTEDLALLAPSIAIEPLEPATAAEDADPPIARPRYRSMPWQRESESSLDRYGWLAVAILIVGLFAWTAFSFWAPAHGGVDQNGYLFGGRRFASSLSTQFKPANPYEYVSAMWVMVGPTDGVYYPKYPIGMSVIYAICLWIGKSHGVTWAFAVSPVAMTAAVFGLFFLAREVAGSFAAVLASLAFATSQITLALMDNPNSHAVCVACVVWGMFLVLRWWQTHSLWQGVLGGFLVGYAFTVRYTEGLLVLPIALAVICTIRWRNWRSYLWSAVPIFGWLFPVVLQLTFNKIAMGSWTGYDTTNESSAFTWSKFVDTWEQVVRMFDEQGLIFALPIAMAGLVLAYWRNWRIGLWLTLWFVPGSMLYTSYYWSPERGVGYARFFLTFLPVLLTGAAICVRYALIGSDGSVPSRLSGGRVAAGFVIGAAAALGVYRAANGLQNGDAAPRESLNGLHLNEEALYVAGIYTRQNIPDGSVVFADEPRMAEGLMNYLQFEGNWHMYSLETFAGSLRRAFLNQPDRDPNNPNPLQPRRKTYMHTLYDGKDEKTLQAEEQKVVKAAFAAGQRVFMIAPPATVLTYQPRYFPVAEYSMTTLASWHDPIDPDMGKLPDAAAPPDPRARGGFGGNGGGGRGRNRPGGGGPGGGPGPRGGFNEWTASSWQLVEITQRLPITPDAAKPTTQPAAASR